jgi:hypothetical protein
VLAHLKHGDLKAQVLIQALRRLVDRLTTQRCREIVQVGVTRLVALVKSLLLFERNTSHGPSTDHALGEAIGWVVEMTTSNVGLSSVSVRPEHDRVKVDPSAARGNQLDSHGTPVGLDSVAAPSRLPCFTSPSGGWGEARQASA